MKRGDVVIVEFPYTDGRQGKHRPAVIVQNDSDNGRLANTVVAMITGNTRHANEPTQVLIDPRVGDGTASGLHGPSAVKCCNLFTIRQQDVKRTIGTLTAPIQAKVDSALKNALGLA
ncbi:MAG: type II toxin-antitoxin system PemK/MazF family toxin [Pirellulales bacterium]